MLLSVRLSIGTGFSVDDCYLVNMVLMVVIIANMVMMLVLAVNMFLVLVLVVNMVLMSVIIVNMYDDGLF